MYTKLNTFLNEKRLNEFIIINGIKKPTKNSKGDFISNNYSDIINFYNWFGNSKFVDEFGRPLVAHHISYKRFSIFKPGIFGKMGAGMYFTSYEKDSDDWKKRDDDYIKYSVYLKSENLAVISNPFAKKELPESYDGILAFAGQSGEEIIVFKPEQIKSIDNDGTYDIDDNDIYS